LTNVGAHGNWWASTPWLAGDHRGGGLHTQAAAVNALGNHVRAIGISVRCVQHLHCFFSPNRQLQN